MPTVSERPEAPTAIQTGCVRQVLQRRSPWAGLCGLAVLGFLELLEIVHIEVAVGLEPVLVSFDGKGSDEASAGV